jgi:hypothetical protein
MIQPVESIEITVLVDNGTDSLSTNPEDWEQRLKKAGMPEQGRFDRMTDGVQRVTGRPAMSVRELVPLHAEEFGSRRI